MAAKGFMRGLGAIEEHQKAMYVVLGLYEEAVERCLWASNKGAGRLSRAPV